MKKILIWDINYTLKNTGGPAGYLYNIREYLKKNPIAEVEIHFLKDILGIPNIDKSINTRHKKLMKFLHSIDIFSLIGYYRTFRCLRGWNKKTSEDKLRGVDLNVYDVIHFHHSGDLYRTLDLMKAYNGTIILTSHSPQPQAYEDVENIIYRQSLIKKLIRKNILNKELAAWRQADYLMFPVEGALDPYFVEDRIKLYKEENSDKFIYCESAILDKPISVPISRDKLGIASDKILISYVGRHNEIKGYDQLKKFAEKILETDDRFVFVIAGNEEPLKRLNHPNWIELGWIDYGNQLVSASDLFVLPNRETYFDLVTLEVMREGTPILMSATGGNKYFSKYGEEYGFYIYPYGDIESEKNLFFRAISDLQNGNMKVKSQKIRELFVDKFTINKYIDRYQSLIIK